MSRSGHEEQRERKNMEENKKTFRERVGELVTIFDASKDQTNSFGHYAYFTAGGVMRKANEFIRQKDLGLFIMSTSSVFTENGASYIRVTSTIYDMWGTESMSATADCREPAEKKGMDASQVSGSSTSYAWKYSLMLLLGLSGQQDADAYNGDPSSQQTSQAVSQPPQTNGVPSNGYNSGYQPQFNGQNNVPVNPDVGQGRFPI